MASQYKIFQKGVSLIPKAATLDGPYNSTKGDIEVSGNTLNFHNGTSSSQILTVAHSAQGTAKVLNKDFDDATLRIINGTTTPKALNFDLSGATNNTKTTLVFSQTVDRTLTIPNTTDTVVVLNLAQTLTNKTLTSPVLNTPTADTITGIAGGDLSIQSSVGYKVIVEGLTFDSAAVTGSNISFNSTGSLGLTSSTSSSITAGTSLTLTGPSGVKVVGPLLVNEVINSSATGANANISAPTSPYLTVTNASLTSIDTIVANSDNEFLVLTNRTGVSININNDTGGTAANRVITGTGSFLTLDNNASIMFAYSSANSRWMVVGGTGSGNASVNLVAGETITAGQAVYVSNGTGTDSGRTAGRVYLLDPTNDDRVEFFGFAINSSTVGNTVRVQTAGGLSGLSGLTIGKPVFASVTSVGGVQVTAPIAVNQWVIPVGIATSATTAVINGAGSSTALKITSSIVDGLYADVQSYSANTTITNANSVVFVSASGGAVTITIPAATGNKGKIFNIKKTDSSLNGVIISPVSGTIDGAVTKTLAFQYDALMLASDGSNYYLI